MNPFASLRSIVYQKRIAVALERLVDIQEEQMRRGQPATGTAFRTGYIDKTSGEGSLLTQTDEEMAQLEIEEREAAARGFQDDNED